MIVGTGHVWGCTRGVGGTWTNTALLASRWAEYLRRKDGMRNYPLTYIDPKERHLTEPCLGQRERDWFRLSLLGGPV